MSWTTAWADNESNVGGFDGSSHSLLQSIYGSQTSQILLSGRQSEAQLVIEEADEDGWSDDDRVTGPVRPSSSQGSLSAAVQRRQTAARPKTAAPHPSHSHYRPTPVSSSTSLISTGSSRGARGMARSSSAVQNRSSSGRSQVHAVGQEQKPVRRRPMSAAVPRSYSMQGGSRRSSLGGGSVGQSQAPSRPRPKSAFVGSTRSTPLLDYDSSEEDQFVACAPPLRNTNPVFRTHVPEYINFWGGKPIQRRDFGTVVHERKSWKRPKSDYGTRGGSSSRKSSATSSGAEKKASDDLSAGIDGGGDSGSQGLVVKEAWGGPGHSGVGGEVGGVQLSEDKCDLVVKEAWGGPGHSGVGGEVGGVQLSVDKCGQDVKEVWSGLSVKGVGGEVEGCQVDEERCNLDTKVASVVPSGEGGEVGVCHMDDNKRDESDDRIGLQAGGGLVLGGLLQGKTGSSRGKDKNKDGAVFSGIGGSLLDGLVNGNDNSSTKPPKRDTSENDRNRKAYRSGTHSENRYGKTPREEEEGSAGSEEDDFFKKSEDDNLPTIPSSTSLTGDGSKGGLDSIEEVASGSSESVSDEGCTVVLPQLVASPPDLLVPPKNESCNVQLPVCHQESYHLGPDTISEPQTLDKPPKNATWLGARLALTRHSTRFELPLDLRDLQGLSPADYLQKYTVVSERRAAHYTKVYRRFLKYPAKSIARKDLVPALSEVHFGTVDEEHIMEVLEVVQLAEEVTDIGVRLFAGLCALAERMLRTFTLPTRSTTALTEYGQHREIVEDADFEALEWRLRGCTVSASLKFDHHVRQVVVSGSELVVEQASSASRWISVHPLFESKNNRPNRTLPLLVSSYSLLYVKKHRVYIASCEDLQIRVYSPNFEVLQGVPMPSSVLCLLYLEESDELLAGGVGQLHTWAFHPRQKNMLTKTVGFTTTIKPQQWVTSLALSQDGKTVLMVTHEGVHLLNLQMRTQANFIPNGHKSVISCALSYMDFIITAGKDGSIKLWSPSIAQVLGELAGHSCEVVGMATHPTKPQLLSAAADGSVRVWGLDTLTELYLLVMPEQNLCSFALINASCAVCYSQKGVTMLNISMPDYHLTALNSKVTSLQLSGSPGRLVAMCEDGGVRLVCPVSGEVVSLVFPVFENTEHTFVDVVYCREHDAALALLKSREVMVFDAQVNPCCCAGLCSPDHTDNGVTCIAAGCLHMEEDVAVIEVVFAGHLSGFISLLNGGNVTMATSTPAHKGEVTALSVSPSHHHLLSLGSDRTMRLWQISLHYGSLSMISLLHITVGRDTHVQHIAFTHSVLCVAFTNATLKTYQLPTSDGSEMKEEEMTLEELPTFTHSRTEDHTGGVLSLRSAPDLPIFCSAGADNLVKLWSLDCLLVCEVHLGAGLSGACVVQNSHNLVVALEGHLWVVEGPEWIGEMEEFTTIVSGTENLQNVPIRAIKERSIAFDSSINFWFDPSRSKRHSIDPSSLPQNVIMPPRQPNIGSCSQESSGSVKLAIKISSVLSRETPSDCMSEQSSVKRHYTATHPAKPSPPTNGTQSQQPTHLSDNSKDEMFAATWSGLLRCQSPDTREALDTISTLQRQPPFVLDHRVDLPAPSQPSHHYFIAPDGFIPNSVIREKIGVQFDPGQFPAADPSPELSFALESLLRSKAQKTRNKVKSNLECRSLSIPSTVMSSQSSTQAMTEQDSTMISASQISNEHHDTWNESSRVSSATTGAPSELNQGQKKEFSKGVFSRPRMKVDLEEIDLDFSMGRGGSKRSPRPNRTKRTLETPRPSCEDSELCISDSFPSCPTTPVSTSSRRSSSRCDSFHSNTSVSRPATRQSMTGLPPCTPSHRPFNNSGRIRSSGGKSPVTKVLSFRNQGGAVVRGDSFPNMTLLQQIVSEQWYPAECRQRVPTAKSVLKTLTGILPSSEDSVLSQVCSSIKKLHNANAIATPQYHHIEEAATEQLKVASADAQVSLLEMITNLSLRGQRLLQSVLPLLVSKDARVRRSSFAAIHQLAGVSSKAGLERLMADMGILDIAVRDEVNFLEGLAGHLQGRSEETQQELQPSQMNCLMPRAGGSKRVSFTLIAVPPVEDCCSDVQTLLSESDGESTSLQLSNGDTGSSTNGDSTTASTSPDRRGAAIENSTSVIANCHHSHQCRKQTRPMPNPSVEMLQRVLASGPVTQDSTHKYTRKNINPSLLQKMFVKNPIQMPMEFVNLLYGQSLQKGKGSASHRKFSWCNVHPVVTQHTAQQLAMDHPPHLPKPRRRKQVA